VRAIALLALGWIAGTISTVVLVAIGAAAASTDHTPPPPVGPSWGDERWN
jgi:hypothetical protein